jgi:hypothetical protein
MPQCITKPRGLKTGDQALKLKSPAFCPASPDMA